MFSRSRHPRHIGPTRLARRVSVAAGALTLLATAVLPAAPAAADANDASTLTAGRIARSLAGGHELGKGGGWQTRAEQMTGLDMFHALRRFGLFPRYRAGILTALEGREQLRLYTGSGGTRHAGAVGKLLYAVASTARPVRAYGDGHLKRDLEAMVDSQRSSPQYGRAVDAGPSDHSDTAAQAWAVRALAETGSKKLPMATRFLLRQQCDPGYFRENMDDADYACPDSLENRMVANVDATGLAVLALQEARAAGVRHLTDDIRQASRWLVRRQTWGGGYYAGGSVNATSTALATEALLRTGRQGAAANSAVWLLRRQVTSRTIKAFPALRRHKGAIAPNLAALMLARTKGISGDARARWERSTAKGALGLPALARATRVDLVAPDHARRGTTVRVKIRGLLARERFVLRRSGRTIARGHVGRGGVSVVRVTLPQRTGRVSLRVSGSRASRHGATFVRVTHKR